MRSDKLRKPIVSAIASVTLVLVAATALVAQSTPPDAPSGSSSASAAVLASSSFPVVFPSVVSSADSSGAPAVAVSPALVSPQSSAPERPHRFFDKWNIALFSGSTALASADFAFTRANLQSNGKELNPIVRMFGRSTAGLAVNFAGEAVGTVGLSYFFHKMGHYKLERAVSMVNIGASGFAVGYSSSHR
jgi:hypothetical protein